MRRFWQRRGEQRKSTSWDLSTPLLTLSPHDTWNIADACMGTIVTGATGSGKTTGPGAAIAIAMLRAGFGGLVLACKNGERLIWEQYCRLANRLDDLIVVDASAKYRFSFLDAELHRAGVGAGLTENIVNLLSTILEIAERNGSQGGREDEGYWRRAMRQLCRNVVDLLILAKGRVTVPDLYRVVISAPISTEQVTSDAWKNSSLCFNCLREADGAVKSGTSQRDFELVADYFTLEFPALSDKTRSVIVSTFTSMVDVLNRSLLRELFSTETNFRPEDSLDGKIIFLELPVKEFSEVGQFGAVLTKHCWQQAIERRDIASNARPVFLFADEFQNFSTRYDMQFQSTARSSRAATVYLTQNVSTLLAAFGGQQAKAVTDSLLGNLQTKIWCGNGDPENNQWAASVIGRSRQVFLNGGRSTDGFDMMKLAGLGGRTQGTAGFSEQMEFEVEPHRFTSLGAGPANQWEVDSIVFQGGRRFAANGKTWLPVGFRQQF